MHVSQLYLWKVDDECNYRDVRAGWYIATRDIETGYCERLCDQHEHEIQKLELLR